MSKCSHLYRRGNVFYFRLRVPQRFRCILQVSEFVQSTHTQDRKSAIPTAHKLAGEAKTLFNHLDSIMSKKQLTAQQIVDSLFLDKSQSNDVLTAKFTERMCNRAKKLSSGITKVKLITGVDFRDNPVTIDFGGDFEKEMEAFERLQRFTAEQHNKQEPVKTKTRAVKSKAPLLSLTLNEWLDTYQGKGTTAGRENKKKLESFAKLFLGHAGDKKIDELIQKDVNQFFRDLVKHPGGRGGYTKAFTEMTLLERIAVTKPGTVLIGPGTFDNNYLSPCGMFLSWLQGNYEDFAPVLSINHIDYEKFGGRRAEGEDKQRSLSVGEVQKLMGREMMKGFAANSKAEHKFWLPMIALFTGARANEICQLNPQHDILQDRKTGIWYFNLTDATEGGAGVDKSHKNESSQRKVPIHSTLIECGFLDYFKRIKALGHDRIFIKWKPKDGKASYRAEEFFRKYLADVKLLDTKTLGRKVLGMHSLRGTFMSHTVRRLMETGLTQNQGMSKIRPIVGHTDGFVDENGRDLTETAGYIDKTIVASAIDNLTELKGIIEVLDYGVDFPKP